MSRGRLVALAPMWVAALTEHSLWLAGLLAAAGVSDALDGHFARLSRLADENGRRLDSLADNLILPSALIWVVLLRPQAIAENVAVALPCSVVYASSLICGLIRFRRLGGLHLWSSKAAGVLLYLLVIDLLAAPHYSRPLLVITGLVFLYSSAETLVLQLARASTEGVGRTFFANVLLQRLGLTVADAR